MLPIPATRDWFSKKSFKGRLDAASSSIRRLDVKSRERASTPNVPSPGHSSADAHMCTRQQFFAVCKPKQLAVKSKVHRQQPAVQHKKDIFAFATNGANVPALGKAGNVRRGLRLCGYGVKDMNAADSPSLHEGTE